MKNHWLTWVGAMAAFATVVAFAIRLQAEVETLNATVLKLATDFEDREDEHNSIQASIASAREAIIVALDRHEEFVSGEHVTLLTDAATSRDDMRGALEFHRGQHHALDH